MTREEALQILDTIPTIGEQVDALEMAISALENITIGHWKPTREKDEWYDYEYECDKCGGIMLGESAFCPCCGAKME